MSLTLLKFVSTGNMIMRLYRSLFAIALVGFTPNFAMAQSDPPAKKAPENPGQHQPQGHTGTLSTDSTKGSPPSSPQGETPNDMQAKPKGEDNGTNK